MTLRSSEETLTQVGRRNGTFICYSQIANANRPKERGLKISFWRKILMAKVVYRGIEYDTQKRLEYQQQMMQQPQQYNETYRGVKFTKEGHK